MMCSFIDLKETTAYDYDDWLELFRKVPAAQLRENIEWIEQNVPSDGYAAAQRWLDIFDHPAKMEKLYKARIDSQNEEDIMDIAVGDDDELFYESLIKKNTAQRILPTYHSRRLRDCLRISMYFVRSCARYVHVAQGLVQCLRRCSRRLPLPTLRKKMQMLLRRHLRLWERRKRKR